MKNTRLHPPIWLDQLLEWICDEQHLEIIQGDLHELFYRNLESEGLFKARQLYFWDVLSTFQPAIHKKIYFSFLSLNTLDMFSNYLKIAFRNLFKRKTITLINILGLAIGIAGGLLSYLHIQYELSYDQYHKNKDQIYRIITGDMASGEGWVGISAPIPPKIQADIPEVIDYARMTKIRRSSKVDVSYHNQHYNEAAFFMADPSLFTIFDFSMVQGNREEVLNDLSAIAISDRKAKQIFGNKNPIGKTLQLNNEFDFQVSGIFQDLPKNSHFDMDFVVSFANLERILPGTSLTGNWGQFNYYAYALLQSDASPKVVEDKIQAMNIKLKNNDDFSLKRLGLQTLSDIHFQHNRGNLKPSYNFNYIYIYLAAALGVVLISFVNFINLTTAGSTKRVKEVGVRKAIGATRKQLIFQFLSESFLTTAIAFGLGLLLVEYILLPRLNDLFNASISLSAIPLSTTLLGILSVLALGILAGTYIAFFVTSFAPVKALKNTFKIGSKNNFTRNSLLGFQFFISILLVAGSIIIAQQMHFVATKNIGLNKDQVIHIPLYQQKDKERIQLMKQTFSNLPKVRATSTNSFQPGGVNWNQTVWWEGQETSESMYIISVDKDFFQTLEIPFIEGDLNFITRSLTDNNYTYVLNEAAKKHIGWQTAVGKKFKAFGKNSEKLISGVIKDFHFQSLHNLVKPCLLVVGNLTHSEIYVKLSTNDLSHSLGLLKQKFAALNPGIPFEYSFLDENFESLYEQEQRAKTVVSFFSLISILLALFGLYGLLSFEITERTKELAIRKILGSSVTELGVLLSKNFIKIVSIAAAIGLPLTWWLMSNWLEHFTYRIAISLPILLLSFMALLLIILITIGVKVITTANANPVEELRYE